MSLDLSPRDQPQLALQGRLSLLLVAPLSALALAGLSPVLPKISAHFAGQPGADVLVRLLVSAVPAAMILGSLLGGLLADRYGQRKVLLWALGLYACTGVSGYVFDNLGALLVSRIGLGICNAAAGVIVAAMITTRLPQRLRGRWLGFLVTAGTVSAIAMLIAVGALGERNWRLVFLLHVAALAAILVIFLFVPEDKTPAIRQQSSVRGKFPSVFALVGIATGALTAISTIFLPYHLAGIGESNAQRIGFAIIPNAIAGGVLSFAYGWILARLGTIKVFAIAFAAGAAGIAVLLVSGNYLGALVGMALVGAGVGLAGPNIIAAAADATPPERRGGVIGIVRAATSAGPLITQLALEPLSLNYGADSALIVLAIVMLLASVLVIPGRRWLLPE
jgi:MFS family permease